MSLFLCKELLIVTVMGCICTHNIKAKPKLGIIQAVRMLSRCITGDALAVKIMLCHQQCGTNCTLFTARKRSLGQGYIFTPVCHSVHRGEDLTRSPPGTRDTPHVAR